MRDVVRSVLADLEADLVELDIRQDPELERRYAREIPVLRLGDAEIARHRTTPGELRRKFADAGLLGVRSGT